MERLSQTSALYGGALGAQMSAADLHGLQIGVPKSDTVASEAERAAEIAKRCHELVSRLSGLEHRLGAPPTAGNTDMRLTDHPPGLVGELTAQHGLALSALVEAYDTVSRIEKSYIG